MVLIIQYEILLSWGVFIAKYSPLFPITMDNFKIKLIMVRKRKLKHM